MNRNPGLLLVAAVPTLVLLSACASGPRHHLADYEFSNGTVGVVFYDPPAPDLRTGDLGLSTRSPLRALASAGGRVVREEEAREAKAKLDTAVQHVDFVPQMAERTLERTARYLGATPVQTEDEAEYLLEVDLDGVGLSAESEEIGLYVIGEAVLLHTDTGREIWRVAVRSTDQVTENTVSDAVFENFLGAQSLSQLTVEDFEALLPQLADYAADQIVLVLRSDLREVRR